MNKFLSTPTDSIHFVHGHYQLMNAKRSNNIGMLFGLTSSYERTLEIVSVNDQNSVVGLGCSCNHVRNEISVAWGIQKCDLFAAYLQFLDSDVNSDSSNSFFFCRICDPSMLKSLHAHLFRLFFVPMQLLFAQHFGLLQKHANKRGFS